MKTRKAAMPAPPPLSDTQEVQAATAIATAINQGLPGSYFARIVNAMSADSAANVQRAAAMTLHELADWFKQDPQARAILDTVPTFPQFCSDFHKEAQKLYPQPSLQ